MTDIAYGRRADGRPALAHGRWVVLALVVVAAVAALTHVA